MALDPVTAITDLVKVGLNKFVGDKISDKDKIELEQNMEMFVAAESRKENGAFRQFVLAYEGSAADYKNFPLVGPLIMIMRGLVRPLFTYATGYFDFIYFTKVGVGWTPEQAQLLAIINVIVLVFWFGEKILVNTGLMDVLLKAFTNKK